MEDFGFHMTLTGRVPDGALSTACKRCLEQRFAAIHWQAALLFPASRCSPKKRAAHRSPFTRWLPLGWPPNAKDAHA
ncbi:hypothetical protein [Rhizobium yanglingense]